MPKRTNSEALVVPVGARLPEVADGSHDETGIDFRKSIVAQAPGAQYTGGVVLDQDVGFLYQFVEDEAAGGYLQIERDAPLVGVEVEEETALFVVGVVFVEGPETPGRVSAIGSFDLDDVCAVVGHELGAVGPGDVLGKV